MHPNPPLNGVRRLSVKLRRRKSRGYGSYSGLYFRSLCGEVGRKTTPSLSLIVFFFYCTPEIKKLQAACLRASRCCCPMQPPALGDTTDAGALFAPAGICSRWYFPVLALLPGSHPSAPFRRRRCGTGVGSAGCSARNGSAVWQAPNRGKASRNPGVGPTGTQGPPGNGSRGVEWK